MPTGGPWSRPALAVAAFLSHAPGLKLLTGRRFTPALVRVNLGALGLTLLAMALAGVAAAPGQGPRAVLVAWLVGHFSWSLVFAAWILRGGALAQVERSSER